MRIVTRKNKKFYKYEKKELTKGIIISIIYYVLAILFFLISVFISILCKGEAPPIVGGIALISVVLDLASMTYIVIDIYLYRNFQKSIRNMLILQLAFILFLIFV